MAVTSGLVLTIAAILVPTSSASSRFIILVATIVESEPPMTSLRLYVSVAKAVYPNNLGDTVISLIVVLGVSVVVNPVGSGVML